MFRSKRRGKGAKARVTAWPVAGDGPDQDHSPDVNRSKRRSQGKSRVKA